MSRAVQCDCCGKMVTPDDAIQLDVTGPENFKTETSEGWGDIDICRECLTLPLAEILKESCRDWPPKMWREREAK